MARVQPYDLKNAISNNRLIGLWRLIYGFRLIYFLAILCLGIAARSSIETSSGSDFISQ
jgi:ATP-binding cassette subfamily B protein